MPDRAVEDAIVRRIALALGRDLVRPHFVADRVFTTHTITGMGGAPVSVLTGIVGEDELRAEFARSFDWYMKTRGPRHYG